MNHKLSMAASVGMNAAITVLALVGVHIEFQRSGLQMLRYYTIDSNLFAAVACALMALFTIRRVMQGREIPAWVKMGKYMAVCCLTVTFIVVVTVLAPTAQDGFFSMLVQGSMLYHHLLCPLLAAASFFLWDRVPLSPPPRAAAVSAVPTLAYALVLMVLNIACVLTGPYPFLYVYRQPVFVSLLWFMVIVGGAYLLGLAFARLRQE